VSFFGKKSITRSSYKLRPRQPGDAPIPTQIAEQLRAAGIDPSAMALVPGEAGETPEALLAALPPAGSRLRHAFAFSTLNAAFAAIEKILDEGSVATIAKERDTWVVTFDLADDPNADDKAEHAQLADRVTPLGATDRGFAREVVTRTEIRK